MFYRNCSYLSGIALLLLSQKASAADPLPSWQDTGKKQQIITFIKQVSDPSSTQFLAIEDRIVVIDNDGTLWAEKPLYPQVAYLMNAIKQQKGIDDVNKMTPITKAVLEKDFAYLSALDKSQLLEGLLEPLAGNQLSEYQQDVRNFLTTTAHPSLNMPYASALYRPMIELVNLLKAHDFIIYIVTGGGEDFVKSISKLFYNIPAEQVLGTRTQNRQIDQHNRIKHHTLVSGMNEGHEKVKRIKNDIGKVPVLAIGNSSGDLEMLLHTNNASKPNMAILLSHDDSKREFSYKKGAQKVLAMAKAKNWLVVSFKEDFKQVFAKSKQQG